MRFICEIIKSLSSYTSAIRDPPTRHFLSYCHIVVAKLNVQTKFESLHLIGSCHIIVILSCCLVILLFLKLFIIIILI